MSTTDLRTMFPDNMLVALRSFGSEVHALRADTGEDITVHIGIQTRKNALGKNKGLRFVHTATNGFQWRTIPIGKIQVVMDSHNITWSKLPKPNKPKTTHITDEAVATILAEAVSYRPVDFVMSDMKWSYLIRSIIRGESILLTGPAGCGKTKAATSSAAAFPQRPFFRFNLGASQDPRGMLIGNTHYDPVKGTWFSESHFIRAIQSENAIIMMDELSRANDDAVNILMTVFDENQRYLRIDEKADTTEIKVANGVTFISTANRGNEYSAARVMDRALLDRQTVTIEMNPMSKDQEFELLKTLHPDAEGDLIKIMKALTEIAAYTREEVEKDDPQINTIIGTRQVKKMFEVARDGFALAHIAEACIYPFYDSAGGNASPRSHMRQVVQGFIPTDLKDKPHPWQAAGFVPTPPDPSNTPF